MDYKRILECLPVPALVLNKQHEVLFVNQAALMLTGSAHEQEANAQAGQRYVLCVENGRCLLQCSKSSCCDLFAMMKLARGNGHRITQKVTLLVNRNDKLERRLFTATLHTVESDVAYLFTFNDITEEQQRKQDLQWESMALHMMSEIGHFHVFEWDKAEADNILQVPVSLWHFCLERPVDGDYSATAFMTHVPLEDQRALWEVLRSLSQKKSIGADVSFRINGSGGTTRWLQMKVSPLPGEEDLPGVRGLGIVQDVTSLKKAEGQARLALEKEALGDDRSNIAAWLYDVAEDLLYISPGYAEMLGYSAGSSHDFSKWTEHVHPDDVEKWVHVVEGCMPSHKRFQLDFRMRTASGDYLWVSSVGTCSLGDLGQVYIRGVCFNINPYVLQEQALSKKSEYHKALNVFSNMLVLEGSLQLKMNDGLGWIGETTESIRVFVVEADKDNRVAPTYEWLRPDAFSLYPDPGVDHALFVKLNAMLDNVMEPVVCSYGWDGLEATVLVQAVRSGSAYLGFVGMARRKGGSWDSSDRDLLKMLADMISLELEREQTTRALVESEAKYRGLFSKTRDAILLLDDDRVFDFNDAARHLFQCGTDWLRFRPFRSMLAEPASPPLPTGWSLGAWLEALPDGGYVGVKGAAGTVAFVAITWTTYEDENKEWTLLSLHDMSGHLEMEQKLKVNELRLRQIVEGTSDLLWEMNVAGKFSYMEGRVQEILGYSPEEMKGLTWLDFMAPDSRDVARDVLDEAIAGRSPIKGFEKWVVAKSGALLCMESNAVPMLDGSGVLLGFRGVEKDITVRKEAERRILWESEINRVSMDVSRLLLEEKIDLQAIAGKILSFASSNLMSKGGVICLNADKSSGWMEYAMDHGENGLHNMQVNTRNYPSKEQEGEVLRCVNDLLQKPVGFTHGNHCKRSVNGGGVFSALAREVESYAIVPVGLSPDLQGWFMLVDRAGGFQEDHLSAMTALANLLVIALNRMQLLSSLIESKETAILANRTKSQFLANMSHEIRTPLNAILGYAQLLLKESSLGDDQREYVNTISVAGKHLLKVINEILEMSRIEAGRVSLRIELFSLRDLMSEMEMIFRQKARSSGLTLKYQLHDNVPDQILCDQIKIRQVVVNLLGNAVKFTEQGGIVIVVDAKPVAALDWSGELEAGYAAMPTEDGCCRISISVADTGKGIAADEIDKVFRPFEQTASGMSSQTGTGLGMSISRKYAMQLGGNVTVESQSGVGSTFLFEFNALPMSGGEVQGRRPDEESTHWVLRAGVSCSVLVVDDNAWNRDVLSKVLRIGGIHVELASSGREALEKLQKHQYDLLMLDLRMPELSGYDVMDRMAELAIKVPVIMVTASAMEDERVKAIQRGATGFVRKPFQEKDVLAALREVLGDGFFVEMVDGENVEPQSTEGPGALGLMELDGALRERIVVAVNEGDVSELEALALLIQEGYPHLALHYNDLVGSFQYDNILRELGCQA